jgi:hypothetical protein
VSGLWALLQSAAQQADQVGGLARFWAKHGNGIAAAFATFLITALGWATLRLGAGSTKRLLDAAEPKARAPEGPPAHTLVISPPKASLPSSELLSRVEVTLREHGDLRVQLAKKDWEIETLHKALDEERKRRQLVESQLETQLGANLALKREFDELEKKIGIARAPALPKPKDPHGSHLGRNVVEADRGGLRPSPGAAAVADPLRGRLPPGRPEGGR